MMIGKRNQLSNRKEQTGFLPPGSLRLGFVGQPFFYPRVPALASARVHHPCAHPTLGGTRKPSVPGRVHSVPERCGSQAAASLLLPGSNPLLTRDTVASPAKCVSQAASSLNQAREQPLPISPKSSRSNPFAGWRLLSKFISCSSSFWRPWWPVPETFVPGHNRTFWP